MSITIEALLKRVELLEAQIKPLPTDETTTKKEKKEKKEKKVKKESASSDDEKPKRVSGYILFSKALRDEATDTIRSSAEPDAKIKSTDVMKELGRMWKALTDEEKMPWNEQAATAKAQTE